MSGSFVIIAIGSDGIIIASDSRAHFFSEKDTLQQTLAYMDYSIKSFPVGNMAMASTGSGLFGDNFDSYVAKLFSDNIPANINAYNLIPQLFKFVKEHSTNDVIEAFQHKAFFSAGYSQNSPVICGQSPTMPLTCKGLGFISTDNSEFDDTYSSKLSCAELGRLAASAIVNYAHKNNKVYTIGGPIRVLSVRRDNNVKWLSNPPSKYYRTLRDFLLDFKESKSNLTFTSDENKIKFYEMMHSAYPDIF